MIPEPLQLDPPPPGVDVVRNGPDLRVAIQWSNRYGALFLAMALLLVPLNVYLGTGGPGSAVLLGTGILAYFGAALRFNTTLVEVVGHQIAIRHAPFPWPGARAIPLTSLQALLVTRRDRGGEEIWDLQARTRYGEVPLLTGFPTNVVPTYVKAVLDDQLTL